MVEEVRRGSGKRHAIKAKALGLQGRAQRLAESCTEAAVVFAA